MTLFKFRSFQNLEFIADILVNQRLYFSDYLSLNDPFEGQFLVERWIMDSSEPGDPDRWIELVDRTTTPGTHEELASFFEKKVPRICSLSESCEDIRMWAHYGDSHKGLAVEVDLLDVDLLRPISYVRSLPTIQELTLTVDSPADGYDILTKKTDHWSYEQEWRLFSDEMFLDVTGRIRSVVLGARFPLTHVEFIKRMAPGIQLKRAVLDHGGSRIRIEDYL